MKTGEPEPSRPRALAVIVNWNRCDALDRMLASLEASGPREFDAVLIDNASTDGSVAMVREKYPWIQIVQNKQNLGGTGGFNCGMRYALNHPVGYEFIWLLDNDVVVHPGAFQGLVDAMESDSRIGIVGSAILLLGDPQQVQEAGERVSERTGEIHRNYEGPVSALPRNELVECDYVAACSLLARMDAVRKVGIWDEQYFLLWDDMDWGIRFRRAGYRVVATAKSLVEHESYEARRGRNPATSLYQSSRNGLYFFWRYSTSIHRFHVLFKQFRMILTLKSNFEQDGRHEQAQALGFACRDFLSGRMGAPPEELRSAARGSEAPPQTNRPVPRLRRIALLAKDNPEIAKMLHKNLTDRFAPAEVDTLILAERPEMLRGDLPRSRILPTTTALQRLGLIFALPFQYQATAAPHFLQPYFFEKCVPYSIRISDDLDMMIRRRSFLRILRLAAARIFILFQAVSFTVRAVMKTRTPVNYHNFSE